MKSIKKITAIAASLVMALSMMTCGATAESWNLRYTPMAPSSDNCSLKENRIFANSSSIKQVTESCTNYSTAQSSNGQIAYVKYWAYTVDSYDNFKSVGFYNHYHYSTQATHTIDLENATPKNFILVVKHELQNPNIRSSMSGTINKK